MITLAHESKPRHHYSTEAGDSTLDSTSLGWFGAIHFPTFKFLKKDGYERDS